MKPCNDAIREIVSLGGDERSSKLWEKLIRYYRRSLVATAIYRFKTFFFGGSLKCRKESYQKAEVFSKCVSDKSNKFFRDA